MTIKDLLKGIFLSAPVVLCAQETQKTHDPFTISGQWRSIYMLTANQGSLKDFEALGSGGNLKSILTINDSWELSAALYTSVNLGIQDLQVPDAISGRYSRYEEGLFDRQNLNNDVVALLGEAYVGYSKNSNSFKIGRFKLNSPQINPQDGRMIPTLVQGFWYKHKGAGKSKAEFGFLNRIAPRSIGSFQGIGASIGTYPSGKDANGLPSAYPGNTQSDFVAIGNIDWQLNPNFLMSIWDYHTDNVSNTAYFKSQWDVNSKWGLDWEWLHQEKIGNGGNADRTLRYFDQENSDVLGLQVRYKVHNNTFSLGYNRIFPGGRFLFPREWGREYFFTFQKLERSEGYSDNHALVFTYRRPFFIKPEQLILRSIISLGKQWKPEISDLANNKYAFPDYTHVNLDLFLDFMELPNLHPEFLLTYKAGNGYIPDNPTLVINKVDMFHLSVIVNYNF